MKPPPRIHIEFAAGSAKAAILRRGPSEWVRLLLWDTSSDSVEAGAWFHGRVYEDSCSLSPNGELFAYLAAKHHGNWGGENCNSWIAVSKPPWLTAIGFWPLSGTQGCAASFIDDSRLAISHPYWVDLEPKDPIPKSFEILSHFTGSGVPEQTIPQPRISAARFNDGKGVDQTGREFQYLDGKLIRAGRVFANLNEMVPTPEPPPNWACSW